MCMQVCVLGKCVHIYTYMCKCGVMMCIVHKFTSSRKDSGIRLESSITPRRGRKSCCEGV